MTWPTPADVLVRVWLIWPVLEFPTDAPPIGPTLPTTTQSKTVPTKLAVRVSVPLTVWPLQSPAEAEEVITGRALTVTLKGAAGGLTQLLALVSVTVMLPLVELMFTMMELVPWPLTMDPKVPGTFHV